MHTSPVTASTINAVLGDTSFLHTFGVPPPLGTDERLRIRTHLAYVEQLLRAAPLQHLASEQQQKRAFLLDKLHEYWQRGRFPKNTAFPHELRPCFIDGEGNICAVGYLVEQDSGRAAAERINTLYQYEYVPEAALNTYFDLHNNRKPHQALHYKTPSSVFWAAVNPASLLLHR